MLTLMVFIQVKNNKTGYAVVIFYPDTLQHVTYSYI